MFSTHFFELFAQSGWLGLRNESLIVPILAIGGGVAGWMVTVVCGAIVRVNCHARDVALKTRLVDAGMSAAEIERVVNSGRATWMDGDESSVEAKPRAVRKCAS